MGSFQSNLAVSPSEATTTPNSPQVEFESINNTGNGSRAATNADMKEAELTGFDLVQFKCRRKEKAYKKCVSKYYSETFLGAQSMNQEEACGELFERYRRCYLKGVQIAVWENNPPPVKDSTLAKFAEEEKEAEENDKKK